MQVHAGHRQRMKDRFASEGLDHFEEHQVLEMLLYNCIPRADTNETAHFLLKRYGSLARVLEAPPEELKKVEGMGEASARYLSFIMAVIRYYQVNRLEKYEALNSVEKCGHYLLPYFCGLNNETVFLLCLDAKCKVLSCEFVGEGSINSAAVPVRRVVEMALGAKATSVVLAHNHPSGIAVPSDEDKQTTWRVANALSAVEIHLVDHIVIADNDFVSMTQSGYYDPSRYQAF